MSIPELKDSSPAHKHSAFSIYLGSADKENATGSAPLMENGKVNVGENSRRAAQAFNALSASDRQVWEDKAAEKNQEENEADEREIATVGEVEFIRRR